MKKKLSIIGYRGQFGNPKDFFQRDWASYQNPFGTLGDLTFFIELFLSSHNEQKESFV
jgi:hypothetical protein